MSDESDYHYDEEIDADNHEKIVENIISLNKIKRLKKPARTEPTSRISEFDLVKSSKSGDVEVDKLSKALGNKRKLSQIRQKLESTKKKSYTLPKPLEKPQSERIKRAVAYERNRLLLDRWEPFVTSNRAQAHLKFPLGEVETLSMQAKEAVKMTERWTVKSELEKELNTLDAVETEEYIIEDENESEFPLTLEELKEKRKEAAKLRAHQSFKEAKARRQNKIKSKKYHRILRKEKIKQKLKEFEELQKTDPELALKKLEEIEKARALERFNLRHKGTGQWAKNKQVRAKYDKESRQVLAEQLKISRDLTQEAKRVELDSDDEVTESNTSTANLNAVNINNPWLSKAQSSKEMVDFVSGYRKFWMEKNANDLAISSEAQAEEQSQTLIEPIKVDENKDVELERNNQGKRTINKTKINPKKVVKVNQFSEENKSVQVEKDTKVTKRKTTGQEQQKKKLMKSVTNLSNSSGEWNIDELFEKAEHTILKKIKSKTVQNPNKTKQTSKKLGNKKSVEEKDTPKKNVTLDMPTQKKRIVIDEELQETLINQSETGTNSNMESLKNILASKTTPQKDHSVNIDPSNFMTVKTPTQLGSTVPDLVEDDLPDEESYRNLVMEAFEDDDVVTDFQKEKQEEIDKEKPQDIDLNLPGWGSWAGTGIDPKKARKRKRFIVKMPKTLPRRDDNKGSLIINEKAASKVKQHQVTEVPFPFKSVKDYEASIRAPIGNTFVPHTAFRRFIRPAVETKMGTIIEPVSDSILMSKKRG